MSFTGTGFTGAKGSTRAALILGVGLALAGCQEGGVNPFKAAPKGEAVEGEAAAPAPASSARIVERDVEAPEVFSVEEAGLWDGRPSLGGVWVAHPTVKDPERVIIRNPANGKFVIGALFRRERENPGPKLQVSSDAAAALDMLAGAPVKLSVVALRREETPVEPLVSAPVVAKPEAAAAAIAAEKIDATPIDGATAQASAETATAEAKPMTAKERRAARKAEREAARAAKAAAKAGGTAATTVATTAAPDAATAAPAAGSAEATAAATMKALGTTPAAQPAKAPVAAPAKAPAKAPAGAKLSAQIGIFSVEANAKRAADQMAKAGIAAQIHKGETQGKAFWRVVAGPAADIAARDALLKKIKGLGYTDAYAVSK